MVECLPNMRVTRVWIPIGQLELFQHYTQNDKLQATTITISYELYIIFFYFNTHTIAGAPWYIVPLNVSNFIGK